MAEFEPRRILGAWRSGYALDLHTLSSEYVGDDEFGHSRFETRRSALGELLYRLKYSKDQSVVAEIADAAARFLAQRKPLVDILVPVPASNLRPVQPVRLLAAAISEKTGIPLVECITRKKDVPPLKDVLDLDKRTELLEGAHVIDAAATEGKRVLLFDDLYRSGATMNAITRELYDDGKAAEVFALTITRTRSNQ
jgi:predicted amidophosphoribosyltransferase